MDQEPRYFCRAFLSPIPKCDSVESNICETWNGSIIKYRGMRLIDMLEGIRVYLMDRFVLKYKMLYDNPDQLCPRIRKRIEKEKALARLYTSRQTLDDKCEVKMGSRGYIVDLNNRSCSCGYWAVSGLPCCHAISAISHLRKDVDSYVSQWYWTHVVVDAYKVGIPCFDGRQAWPEASGYPVLPPKQRAMPGRPKKNRRKAAHEFEVRPQAHGVGEEVSKRGTLIHCGKCGAEGHNARTCKSPTVVETPRTRSRTLPRSREATQQQPASATGKRTRVSHCSKCGSATHNARTCPLNQGVGIQQVRLNVDVRRTIEREMRVATRGIGVYVDETTGNQYVKLNGARGRVVDVGQPTVVDVQGSQPPATQLET
ncbi:unnamed protein product [Linum trigynum]|uniref:SWIM-type domain-containing protein n=1 Tax=Linum trigynum TaxID=586398 RepID=A0AAV2F091_9ROSI